MSALSKSKLSVWKWLGILPEVAALVGEAKDALADGKLDDAEVHSLGARLVAIVASVV